MQITRATEYGVLGLIALSRRAPGEVAMADVVGQEEDIPVSFLGKIFQALSRAGLVRSARGSGGGFCLAREASEISVLQVVEAIEGPLAFTRCLDEETGCEHAGGCALCSLFSEAQDRVKEVFARTTIAELATRHLPGGRVRSARERTPIVFRPAAAGAAAPQATPESEPAPVLDPARA